MDWKKAKGKMMRMLKRLFSTVKSIVLKLFTTTDLSINTILQGAKKLFIKPDVVKGDNGKYSILFSAESDKNCKFPQDIANISLYLQ